jgi:hypothetical protein
VDVGVEFVGYLGFWHFGGLVFLGERRWGDEKRERCRHRRDRRERMGRYERKVVNDECNQLPL